MDVLVKRYEFNKYSTFSKIYVDGVFCCDGLELYDAGLDSNSTEDEVTKTKQVQKCCIPYGVYKITLTYSNSFGRFLPLINGVTGFVGVRIHEGNTVKSTRGCILVGKRDKYSLLNTRKTVDGLTERIKKSLDNKDEVYIKIEREENFPC